MLCHDFLSKYFFLTVPKTFIKERFSVSVISAIEKISASEGYVTIFCRIFFCLTMSKNFIKERFSVSVFSGIEKFNG